MQTSPPREENIGYLRTKGDESSSCLVRKLPLVNRADTALVLVPHRMPHCDNILSLGLWRKKKGGGGSRALDMLMLDPGYI